MNLKIVLKISLLVMVLGLVSLTLHQTYADFINTMDNEEIQIEQMSDDLDLYISEVTEISKENESEESDETDTYEDVELEREQYPELELNDDQAVGNDILEEDVDPIEDEALENEDSVEAIEMSNDDVIPVFDENELRNAVSNAPIDGTLRIVEVKTDFDLTGVVNIPSDTNIMLRSDNANQNWTLTRTGSATTRHFNIQPYALFTLGDGIILTANPTNATGNAGGVHVQPNAEFTMIGGEISGNQMSSGAGVTTEGTFVMIGGTISGNTSTSTGGGVRVANGGTFTMKYGEISGNIANTSGGGLRVVDGATFTMEGGEISGNTANNQGGGVSLTRDAEFWMSDGDISGSNTAGTTGGGVRVMDGATFTMEGGEISGNTADTTGGGVSLSRATFTMEDGEISGNTANSQGGGVILTNDAEFWMSGGEISGSNKANTTGGGVRVMDGATFTMEGGEISGNTSGNQGGGVSLISATFTMMEDGKIRDNTSNSSGGGIYVASSATFTMEDGEISNNTSTGQGGGVRVVDGATFTMEDGEIRDNTAANNQGGGVSLSRGAEFRMNDGEIRDNEANTSGGGVDVSSGIFTMNGGGIIDNEANTNGGGVRVTNGATFTMEGGQISENTASVDGGGISLIGPNTNVVLTGFTESDIEIFGNDSGRFGGGIAADNVSSVRLNNILIYNNEAQYGGGFAGISNNTHAELTGVRIHNNTAFNSGGGIYLAQIDEVTLNDTVIEENDAIRAGGMYVGGNIGALVIDGSEIKSNEADVVGGIYVSNAEAIYNVTISSTTDVADNTAEDNTRAFNNDYNDTHNKYANGRINPGPWIGEDGSHVFNTVDMNASGFEIVVRLQYNFEGSSTTTFEQFEFSSDDRILSSSEVWDEHIAGKEPTRLGHNFIGWSYTPEGEIIDSTQLEGEVILADLNAYAQWEPDPTFLNVSIPTAVFFQSKQADATQLVSPRYTIRNNSIMGVHVDVANFQENNATGINLIDELNIRSTPTSSTPITLITNGSIESIPIDNSRLLEIPGLTDGSFEFSGRSNVTTQFENPSFYFLLRFEVANVPSTTAK